VNTGGKVIKVDDLRGTQPAYTTEEIKEARKIAEQDSRIARVAKMKGAFVSEFGPDRAADNARRIGLRYAVVDKGRAGPHSSRIGPLPVPCSGPHPANMR
jgi:hypothetical protein